MPAKISIPTESEQKVIDKLMQWFGVTDQKYVTRDFLQEKIKGFNMEERAEYARQLFARMTATTPQTGYYAEHICWLQLGRVALADLSDMLHAMLATLRVTKPDLFIDDQSV